MKKIFLTGASGFIGSRLYDELKDEYQINGSGRYESPRTSTIWDLRSEFPITAAPPKVDIIIHAGALLENESNSYEDYHFANVRSCTQLVQYAEICDAKHIIYLSTGGIYMPKTGWITETDPIKPVGFYAQSKYLGETEFQKLKGSTCLTILRLFFPYGPGQKGRLIPNLIKRIRSDQAIQLNNQVGSPQINPIYIADLINILLSIIKHKITGIFNVGGVRTTNIRDLSLKLGNIIGKDVKFVIGDRDEFDLLGDSKKLLRKLPKVKFTGIQKGMKQTIEQYISESGSF